MSTGRHDRKGGPYDRTHLRGLAYHQAVAGRLRKQTVADAKYVLYRWREQGRIDPYTRRDGSVFLPCP